MDSVFMEKIVRKRKQSLDYLKVTGYVFAPVIIFLVFIQIPLIQPFLPMLIIGLIAGAYWLITGLNREYEYIITDQYVDIDCIIAKRRRIRVFSGDAKEFEIAAGTNTDYYGEYSAKNIPKLDFAPMPDSAANYFLVTKNNAKKAKTKGQSVLVIFEPDTKMIDSLHKYNPLKIKK